VTRSTIVKFGRFVLDGSLCELRRDGRRVDLCRRPMDLLWYLIEHRDRVVPGDEIHQQVWSGVTVSNAALSTALRQLRKALDDHDRILIQTLRGHGYRFTGDVQGCEPTPNPVTVPAPAHQARTPADSGLVIALEALRRELQSSGVVVRMIVCDAAPAPLGPPALNGVRIPSAVR